MPIFTSGHRNRSRLQDAISFEELTERADLQHQVTSRPQSARPVRISVSAPTAQVCPVSPTSATSLLGSHVNFAPPVPSYETIQRDFAPVSAASPESTLKPPSYNPRWERLPVYGNEAERPTSSWHNILGTTPPSYWTGATTMVPIATGGGGMFFNSPFQHYQLIQQTDVEEGRQQNSSDRICGMSVGRADIVINLSLLALCILIWSAVVLSLNYSEPRNPGAHVQESGQPAYPNYGRPFMY